MGATAKTMPRQKFASMFMIIGGVLIVSSILIGFFAPKKQVYDLWLYILLVGIAAGAYGGMQFARRNVLGPEVEFSKATGKNFLTNNAIMLALLVLVVFIMFKEPRFLKYTVLLDIIAQASPRLIIALGICFTLLIAGTDLSAGRMVGLAAVLSTSMLQTATYANRFFPDMPALWVGLPILIGIVACVLFGLLNGFLVAKFDMHPFIATLAVQVIIYGACSLYFDMPPNNSQPLGGVRPDFTVIGQHKIAQGIFGTKFAGISILIPIALVITILIWFVLNKTVFGKNVYAVGGNREAAVVSGVNVFKTILMIFTLAAFLYGIAGTLEAARTAGATNNYGNGYELDAIAACVVGGVSLNGGIGKVGGIISGVLIFQVIQYGLQFLGVSPMWQQVIKGIIIAVAVAIDMGKYRRK